MRGPQSRGIRRCALPKPVTALAVMLALLAVPYLPVPGEAWRSLRVVRAPWERASPAAEAVPGADREVGAAGPGRRGDARADRR